MELTIKNFFLMNQAFTFVAGVMGNRLWIANSIDVKVVASMGIFLIAISGIYVSYKGLYLLFSRNYKKVK